MKLKAAKAGFKNISPHWENPGKTNFAFKFKNKIK